MLKNTSVSVKKIYLLIPLYIAGNILILTRFPFVHSDETWLSGLSRNILETGNFAVTEAFFDLYPRNPHAIKSLFHSMQIVFIKILGYEIFSVRLLSFIFGLLSLYCFYKLCRHLFASEKVALAASFFLAADIQFVYASHFARQEIILLFVLLFSLYYFLARLPDFKFIHHLLLGLIIGLSIGIHPNSFIISLPLVFLYLFHIIITKKLKLSGLFIYAGTTACFALFFVVLSFSFDPDFIRNYLSYGQQFGVTNPFAAKLQEFIYFYLKLYWGISGTYYTPNIKLQFYLFASAFLVSFFLILKEKNPRLKENIISIFLAVLAVNAGIIIIGRFNQTSVVFLTPLFYILIAFVLVSVSQKPRLYLTVILAVALSLNSAVNIAPYLNNSYDRYLEEISKAVQKEDTVLANLNAEMYFASGKLYDYRNLAFLADNNLTFEEYISRNKIKYIIYPDEMDFIYAYRPTWNNVYGDVSLYYADMQEFLRTKTRLVYEFTEPTYGMRIARYINQKDWKIKIYKVSESN